MPLSVAEIQQKIIAEARRQGVDPALALGIAQAESSFNPNSVGDRGKAIGLFQLQPAAASDVGLRPEERYDVDKNIAGGIAYLRNRQRREGDEDRGISAYNQGIGMRGGQLSNPQYVRTVRQYQQELQPVVARSSPSLLKRVMGAVQPSRAEAATLSDLPDLPDRPASQGQTQEALPDLPDRPAPATGPAAETFPPLAEQEAAATQQALYGRPAGSPVTPQTLETPEATMRPIAQPPTPEAAAPLPATGQASPSLVARLGQAAETASRGTIAGQVLPFVKPVLKAQYGEQLEDLPKAAAAAGQSAVGTWSGAALGARLGGLAGPVGAAIGGGLGAIGGSLLARRANVESRLEPEGGLGNVLSVVAPAVPVLWGAGKAGLREVVKRSRGWKAVTAADEATVAAQKAYQEGAEAAAKQTAAQRAQAITQQQARETVYQQQVERQQAGAAARHQAAEAQRAQQVAESQAKATTGAAEKTQQQAAEYAEQVQRYEQAVASQRQATTTARALPSRYTPETPSHVLYKKVGEIAPEAPVTLGRTQEVAAELQDVLGQVPSLQPSRLQALLTDMRAARSTQSLREVQRYLTDLGTLTRSNDSATRRTAKQLYGALHDDLAESAMRLPETEAARDLLLQANATFRREMATRDLSGVIRRAITVGDDGIPRLAPGRALTQFDRLVEGDRFFAGSFPPDDLAQIRSDLAALTSAQKIPPRPGAAPTPVQPQAVEPFTPTPLQPPAPPARRAPYSTWKPDVAGPTPPKEVLPTLAPREVQDAVLKGLRSIGWVDALAGGVSPIGGTALVLGSKNAVADGLAHLIINPTTRPYMQKVLNWDGSINKKALIALAGGRAAIMAERNKERNKEREERH